MHISWIMLLRLYYEMIVYFNCLAITHGSVMAQYIVSLVCEKYHIAIYIFS